MSILNKNQSLQHELLDSVSQESKVPSSFHACLNAHGLYHSMHFVLRLSPVTHELVDSAVLKDGKNVTWRELQAFSTYLHETVHWWQHIGSTTGFVLSMSYPAQAHNNLESLTRLARSKKVGKSIRNWAEKKMLAGKDHSNEEVAYANIAVNNVMDTEYYRAIILRPKQLPSIASNKYFECVGHSVVMAYGTGLKVRSNACENASDWLPDYEAWDSVFEKLRSQRCEGFFTARILLFHLLRDFR